jgi:serine/threonine protein kinase
MPIMRRGRSYQPGDEPVPGYRLIRYLNRGQFGEVWTAYGPGHRKVALKIIDLRGREGLKEFEGLERIKDISHPNLAPIFAFWVITSDGQVLDDASVGSLAGATQEPSKRLAATLDLSQAESQPQPVELVMAMVLGSATLAQRLEECQKGGCQGIPPQELLSYMEDAARGIDYLNAPIHESGSGPNSIIHGDIKPQNMLLVGGAVQICDFGLARAVESLRKTATAMGTYAYAAPELLMGKAHSKSDQYCLAITYVELRTGDLPLFGETNLLAVAELHRQGKLDFSKLTPGERLVMCRATLLDPQQRWGSCVEMVRALRRACEIEEVTPEAARASGMPGGTQGGADLGMTPELRPYVETVPLADKAAVPKRRRISARWLLLLLAMVAAGGGVAVWYLWPKPPPPKTAKEFHTALTKIDAALAITEKPKWRLELQSERDALLGQLRKCVQKEGANAQTTGKFGAMIEFVEVQVDFGELTQVDAWEKVVRPRWLAWLNLVSQGDRFVEAFAFVAEIPEECAEKAQMMELLCGSLQIAIASADEGTVPTKAGLVVKWLKGERRERLSKAVHDKAKTLTAGLADRRKFDEAFCLLDDLPPGVITDDERLQLAEELAGRLSAYVEELANDGRFREAVSQLHGIHAKSFDEAHKQKIRKTVADIWDKKFHTLLPKQFNLAEEMLKSDVARQLFAEERLNALRAELWLAKFKTYVEEARFIDAADLLDSRPPGVADAEVKAFCDKLRDGWSLQLAQRVCKREEPSGMLDEISKLLAHFPESLEGIVLQARVHGQQGKVELAWEELQKLKEVKPRPTKFLPLSNFIKLLADYRAGKIAETNLNERREAVKSCNAAEPEGPWRLSPEELAALEGLGPWQQAARALEAAKAEFLKDGDFSRVDAELREADNLLASLSESSRKNELLKQRDLLKEMVGVCRSIVKAIEETRIPDAERDLGSAESLVPRIASDKELEVRWQDKIARWKSDIQALKLPPAPAPSLSPSPDDIATAKAAANAVLGNPAANEAQIDVARKTVRDVQKAHPAVAQQLAPFLARLCVKGIERAAQCREPKNRKDLAEIESDWKALRGDLKKQLPGQLVDAWECESRLLWPKAPADLQQAIGDGDNLPRNSGMAYVAYVRALALQKGAADAAAMLDALYDVFPPGPVGGLAPELAGSERFQKVASWAASAADDLRRVSQSEWNTRWAQDQADKVYHILSAVNGSGRKLADPIRIKANLALAAIAKAKPDIEKAQSLTSELVKIGDGALKQVVQPDATPVLYAYVKSRDGTLPRPRVQRTELVVVCTRLLRAIAERLAQDSRPLSPQEATALFNAVLKPALAVAKDTDLSEAAEFLATAGIFVWDHRHSQWPTNVDDFLGELFDAAIEAGKSLPLQQQNDAHKAGLAKCYVYRAKLRLEHPTPAHHASEPQTKTEGPSSSSLLDYRPASYENAIREGTNALELLPNFHPAHGLLAKAYLLRAESRTARREYIDDLKKSISNGEKAVANSATGSPSVRADYLLNLSQAYLERTNYDNDNHYQESGGVKADLGKAIKCATDAEKLGLNQKDFPYMAAGNAYEDLAWIAEDDPARNYLRAIESFRKAAKNSIVPAQAYCSIGRCYYKAIVDTCLAPLDLERPNIEAVYSECARDFSDSIGSQPDRAEAYIGRAQLYDYYARLPQNSASARSYLKLADDDYASALKWAGRENMPHVAFYAVIWAEFPLRDDNLEDSANRYTEVKKRAAKLAGLPRPPGGSMEPSKEVIRIDAVILRSQKEYDKAISLLDDKVVTGDDSDYSVLLERAGCRFTKAIGLADTDPAKSVLLEQVSADADRARTIAIGRSSRIRALDREFLADEELYYSTRRSDPEKSRKFRKKAIDDATRLVEIAPRRPHRPEWAAECAKLLFDFNKTNPASQTPQTIEVNLDYLTKAMSWHDFSISLTTAGAGPVALNDMRTYVDQAATYREAAVQPAVQINPKVLKEFDIQLHDMKEKYHLK